ncbi:hypothetical protein [Granulicella sibirica]|uniref:Uncharacterized protein n=1 Tax=Granulicella sibirica TaxID=2479048 RepID=A0A4Q0SZT0_9BACT|nr:hypothetical protein [Granulicella sibirica]RXH56417.1 hypothetical protein GRAN_3274 [Granulicella sibirica]
MTKSTFYDLFLLFLFALMLPFEARAEADPNIPVASGYVTWLDASGAFAVNGYKVQLGPSTVFNRVFGPNLQMVTRTNPYPPYLGERIDVFGKLGKKHSVLAERIVLQAGNSDVSGRAIIDRLPQGKEADGAGVRIVRADGYLLRLTNKTKLTFSPPLASIGDLDTNLWIEYHGARDKSGQVIVDHALLSTNLINASEDKLREKNEYDPAEIDDGDRQGFLSKHVLGMDPRRIPAYVDKPMQERIDRIGKSLIPAYQRSLPASDETKIEFRFQLIDDHGSFSGITLPSGVILIQRTAVERLTDDSQLAAVIADYMAGAIEKGEFRFAPAKQKLLAADAVGAGAGLLIPGFSLATTLTTAQVGAHLLLLQQRQRSRVSLFLMEDAGYDKSQAPIAWWLLASKKTKPIDEINVPERSKTLYEALGTTFHPQT